MPQLRELTLGGGVTDRGLEVLAQLREMPNLKKYHAGYNLITDTSLELLARINSLEEISFEAAN